MYNNGRMGDHGDFGDDNYSQMSTLPTHEDNDSLTMRSGLALTFVPPDIIWNTWVWTYTWTATLVRSCTPTFGAYGYVAIPDMRSSPNRLAVHGEDFGNSNNSWSYLRNQYQENRILYEFDDDEQYGQDNRDVVDRGAIDGTVRHNGTRRLLQIFGLLFLLIIFIAGMGYIYACLLSTTPPNSFEARNADINKDDYNCNCKCEDLKFIESCKRYFDLMSDLTGNMTIVKRKKTT